MSLSGKPGEWRASACSGKQAFDSALLANKVIRRRGRSKPRGQSKRQPECAYRCKFCGAWHLGGKA